MITLDPKFIDKFIEILQKELGYDPPGSDRDGIFYNDYEVRAYTQGFAHGIMARSEKLNPYEESGHERCTMFCDTLNYEWYSGYQDGYERRGKILEQIKRDKEEKRKARERKKKAKERRLRQKLKGGNQNE